MPSVFWIEDEAELLPDTFADLKDTEDVNEVEQMGDASSAWAALEHIKSDGGPIILDLWIPPGPSPLPPISHPLPSTLEGPGVGLHLLHLLLDVLGADWPIFVVSGNLTLDIKQ
jgi:hypothetical protein